MFLVLALASVPFSYDGNLRPGQTLAVHDINGNVRVTTGDRLTVRATKHARTGDPTQVTIRVDPRPDGLAVCVRYAGTGDRPCSEHVSNHEFDNDTQVDFDIVVPHGVLLEARTVNGAVDAQTDGTIDAGSVNGNVRAEGRDVRRATSVNGSVSVRVLDRSRGNLATKTVNGSIRIELPSGSGVTLDAKTLTGSITADGLAVARPPYGPGASASGTLGDGARHITAETVNGSITLTR